MKKRILLFVISSSLFSVSAQNCSNTSIGFTPIMDLGSAYFRGSQGGLYPGGSNYAPPAHHAAGMNLAQNVLPLDTAGNVDMVTGKIVWLSVGMSNTTMETQFLIPMTDTFALINPKLVLVDGAQGGQDINTIINPNANFWTVIQQRIANAGLTNKQVQAIWFKQAEAQPNDTAFATYPDALKMKFKTALQIEKNYFPNTKIAYLSDRIYAGYTTTTQNPEPYAYYTGWCVKRLIEDQINGDTSLSYAGSSARVPLLAWGPDLWADGTTPRSDGLTWICPDDYNSDGTHPSSPNGRQKVANLLFNFFTTDSTAIPWFLDQTATDISSNESVFSDFGIYPAPARNSVTLEVSGKYFDVTISDLTGRKIFEKKNNFSTLKINAVAFLSGVYFVRVNSENKSVVKKLVIEN